MLGPQFLRPVGQRHDHELVDTGSREWPQQRGRDRGRGCTFLRAVAISARESHSCAVPDQLGEHEGVAMLD